MCIIFETLLHKKKKKKNHSFNAVSLSNWASNLEKSSPFDMQIQQMAVFKRILVQTQYSSVIMSE